MSIKLRTKALHIKNADGTFENLNTALVGGQGKPGENYVITEEDYSEIADVATTSLRAEYDQKIETLTNEKQDVISDLDAVRAGAAKGATAMQSIPDTYRTADEQDAIDSALSQRIDSMEVGGTFPNATIIGEPLLNGSQVSRFDNANYMIFPFVVDVRNKPFTIEFTFATGSNITTQQNVLDSRFGLALAIANGRGLMALSSNGTSWDIGTATGTHVIEPNSVYHARIAWDGSAYTGSLSEDGTTYVQDMVLPSTAGLHPETMYIGGSPDLFGAGSAHPFGGIIDMGESRVIISGIEVWHGMDNPGLASRANVSLSNLDAMGEARLEAKQDTIPDLAEIREGAAMAEQLKGDLAEKVGYSEVVGNQLLMYSDSTKSKLLATMDLPLASANNAGIVQFTDGCGVQVNAQGKAFITPAGKGYIDAKTDQYRSITPSNIDYATMKALTDPQNHTWTDEQQTAARETLGAIQLSDIPYAKNDGVGVGIISPWTGGGIQMDGSNSPLIKIRPAAENDIDAKSSLYYPIAPRRVDYAVMSGLTDPKNIVWTAEQQAAACETLGATYDGKYELIETIVVDSDKEMEGRDATPSGVPYNFRALIVKTYYEQSSDSNTYCKPFLKIRCGSTSYVDMCSEYVVYPSVSKSFASFLAELKHGLLFSECVRSSSYEDNMNTVSKSARSLGYGYGGIYALASLITGFKLEASSSKPLKSGTIIKIWGLK